MKPGNPGLCEQSDGCQFPQRILEDELIFPFLCGRNFYFIKGDEYDVRKTFIYFGVGYRRASG